MCAQSISGTSLATNAAAASNEPCYSLQIAWGQSAMPSDWSTEAENETGRLLSWKLDRQLSVDPLRFGDTRPATLSLTLSNDDLRYSAFNTSSAITSDILGSTTTPDSQTVYYPKLHGSPVRLRLGYTDSVNGNEYVTSFTGRIDDRQTDAYGISNLTLSLNCLDRSAEIVDRRDSSETHVNIYPGDWIAAVLGRAGITSFDLDQGWFRIPYAWMDDETIWQECNDAAGADGGYFFFSETGVATYRGPDWWLTATDSTTTQATITTANIQNIIANTDWSTLASGLVLPYTPRVAGGEQVLYASQDVVVVPPGEKRVKINFSYPRDDTPLGTPSITAVTSGGRPLTGVTLVLDEVYAQRATLVFNNSTNITAFVTPFDVLGYALVGTERKTIEPTITSLLPYAKTVKPRENPYIQTDAQATLVASLLGERLRYPRFVYTLDGFPAMPWLQLGDSIHINVTDPYTADRDAIIIGISMSGSPSSPFVQQLTAIDTAALYEYASQYFVIGTSVYGDHYQDSGKVWL